MNSNANSNGFERYSLPTDTHGSGGGIEFEGKVVAFVSSDPSQLGDRWTELCVYETKGGNFITQSTGRSVLPHEVDYTNCKVHDNLESISEFFKVKGKYTWLSRQLFADLHKVYPEFAKIERVE